MILQALYEHYKVLLNNPDNNISPPMYSPGKVSFCLVLSADGELLDIMDLRISEGKKSRPRILTVPEQPVRTSGISPYFLCDNTGYVLGIGDKKGKEKFKAFCELHESILNGCISPDAKSILSFIRKWAPDNAAAHPVVKKYYDVMTGSNVVFRLDGSYEFIHDVPEIKAAWEKYATSRSSGYETYCLVTGQKKPIAKIHPNIKGVAGAQSSGAALVSFNIPSFCSYGKEQSYNAPVSEEAASGYTKALNYLLSDPVHRIPIADTTTVFWAEKPGSIEENLFSLLLDPPITSAGDEEENTFTGKVRDPETELLLKDSLKRVIEGIPFKNWTDKIDGGTRFYVLGLSPNNARLAVRFWQTDTLDGFASKIGQHYADLKIEGLRPNPIPIRFILRETAVERKLENVAPTLEGSLMRAILNGDLYPSMLYTSILGRIRADHEINSIRAALVKAYLLRRARRSSNNKSIGEEDIALCLNLPNGETAKQLGRLFAVLEKVQQDAYKESKINATIKDRYFNSASSTPAYVFPQLLKLANYHLSKLAESHRIYWENQITKILSSLDIFPSRLNLEEQGLFVLGYYHQREYIYKKKEEKEGKDGN